jgi:hypothetical protein
MNHPLKVVKKALALISALTVVIMTPIFLTSVLSSNAAGILSGLAPFSVVPIYDWLFGTEHHKSLGLWWGRQNLWFHAWIITVVALIWTSYDDIPEKI